MLFGNTLTTLFIFIFLYIGNSYTYLFVSPSKNRFVNLSESFNPANCQQIIQPNEMQEIYNRVNAFMEQEKPFVKGQLTLKELSELTGIPSASISQSINKLTGKSVTDFINRHRVELLKSKIANPENQKYKLMILAEECGINSKATLNRIFKQHTDQTPGEYLKKVSG
jgi:AraC-like DNA-binding protein